MLAMIYITASSKEEAKRIGEAVVKERLAACANIIPEIYSIYWWKSNLEKSPEAVLLLKTTMDKAEEVIRRVKELHSYEVPDITVIPIEKGLREYIDWVKEEVKP